MQPIGCGSADGFWASDTYPPVPTVLVIPPNEDTVADSTRQLVEGEM